MKFFFKAKTKAGELKEGSIDAASADAAIEVLQKNDLFPIAVTKEDAKGELAQTVAKYLDRVNTKELMMFFKQLSILIEAKVPVVGSLLAIKEQMGNKYFRGIIEEMVNDIQDGAALSDALAKHRNVFPSLSISIIKSGEVSGNLKKSIDYVTKNIEKNYNLTNKVRSALMYPVIVMVVFFIIAFLVLTFIVPKLTTMIKDLGVALPWYTKAIVALSDFMNSYWWAVLIIIVGFVGTIIYYAQTEKGKREWHHWQLKLPIFGPIFQNVYIARFSDNLNILLVGGIPIVQAIMLAGSVTDNTVYQNLFAKVADEVKRGGSMSAVMSKSTFVPPIVAQMVKIGEESGEIDLVLRYVAEFYEAETDLATRNLSTLIEPVMMIIIGIGVGFLVVSIIMPIYDIAGKM